MDTAKSVYDMPFPPLGVLSAANATLKAAIPALATVENAPRRGAGPPRGRGLVMASGGELRHLDGERHPKADAHADRSAARAGRPVGDAG